jgi:hypothetical protein
MEPRLLLGVWVEDPNAAGPAPRDRGATPPIRRTVEFFGDGTAVAVADFPVDPCTGRPDTSTTRFSWVLKGSTLETVRDGAVDVTTVTRLTEGELHVAAAGSSFGKGYFFRQGPPAAR